VIDFSDSVYTYGEGLLVRRPIPRTTPRWKIFKGEVVGAQGRHCLCRCVEKDRMSPGQGLRHHPDILRDVNTGRLKAGFADYPILAYNLKQADSGSASGRFL